MILIQPVFLRSVILAAIFGHTLRPCVQMNYGKEIMFFFFSLPENTFIVKWG